MTEAQQNELADIIKSKPAAVQEVIKILAVKMSMDEPMETDEQISMWMLAGLTVWESGWPHELRNAGISEAEAAETIIRELRADPKYGWSHILRHGTN